LLISDSIRLKLSRARMMAGQKGFCDVEERLAELTAERDLLEKLSTIAFGGAGMQPPEKGRKDCPVWT
jgi:hypothetical protein